MKGWYWPTDGLNSDMILIIEAKKMGEILVSSLSSLLLWLQKH